MNNLDLDYIYRKQQWQGYMEMKPYLIKMKLE